MGSCKENVFIDCNLPYCESKEREIWTATEIQHALEICEDQILYLCINLSFSCSLRIGELLALLGIMYLSTMKILKKTIPD